MYVLNIYIYIQFFNFNLPEIEQKCTRLRSYPLSNGKYIGHEIGDQIHYVQDFRENCHFDKYCKRIEIYMHIYI